MKILYIFHFSFSEWLSRSLPKSPGSDFEVVLKTFDSNVFKCLFWKLSNVYIQIEVTTYSGQEWNKTKTFLRRSRLLLFMTQQFCFSHTNLKSRRPGTYFLAFSDFFSCGNSGSFLVFLSLQKSGKHCIWFILFYKHVRMNHTYVFSGCDDAYFHVAWSHRQRPLYSCSPFPRHRYEGLISSHLPLVLRCGPLCPDSFEIL